MAEAVELPSMQQTSPIRVLCLSFYPAAGPSVRHRISAYAPTWAAQGFVLTHVAFLTLALYRRRREFGLRARLFKLASFAFCTVRLLVRLTQVSRFDLVIIHREIFPLGGAFFERLVARLNPRVIYDFDDALWEPMPLAVNQRARMWDPTRFAQMMQAATAIVAGNTYLASYAASRNPCVHVIPTPYRDLAGAAAARAGSALPIVVWIGNVGNDEYLDLVRRPLERAALEHDFVLRIIGGREAAAFAPAGVRVETCEWREEREGAWLQECAIGIMPLFDRDYERGKCAFKIVQYFSAGMPVVASPVGMNCTTVEHGVNGYLATTEDDWFAALTMLLGDPERRRAMGREAYQCYRERFTIEANAHRWLDVLRAVVDAR